MNEYTDNTTIYCSACNKLRYMGRAESSSEYCVCNGQDAISTYDITSTNKVDQIRHAITKARDRQSKMDEIAWGVPALSSLNIRHLMNNLGAISTRYFECGTHVGGLFSSVIRNNYNLLSATANDSFASDETGDVKYEPQFYANMQKCISPTTEFKMLKGDTFDFKPEDVLGPIDLYLFDANHSYEAQRQAMTHFLPAMADEFIVCVDDYDWKDVMTGTGDGLRRDADLDFLFQQEFYGNDHDNDGWWNGFYIALLKKK